jgi:glutamate/tyrosine decarboxylase-like PLP-dependent enzyme
MTPEAEEQGSSAVPEETATIKSYREHFTTYTSIPPVGRPRQAILAEMEQMRALEAARWGKGYASGAVYHGAQDHIDFLNSVYALNSQANPLHADLWPSAIKFESEIVAMTAAMLGAKESGAEPGTKSMRTSSK